MTDKFEYEYEAFSVKEKEEIKDQHEQSDPNDHHDTNKG